MPVIENQQLLPVLWDALIEAGYKVHLDAPDCEFIYVAYPSQLSSLVLRTEFSYSISVRSCLNLTQNNKLSETVTTLAKMILNEYCTTSDDCRDIYSLELRRLNKTILEE